MINTLKIFDELKESLGDSAAKKIAGVIGKVYEELQNTVTKVEFNELKNIVKELAEAQNRTEQRIEELAEAQKRTEQRVEELAEAQKRTEQEVSELVKSLNRTRTMVGGLSDAVGYGLEDRAIKSLPLILKNKYNIEVITPLVRKYVRYNSTRDELNIYGTGKKGGKELFIIGEAKARLSKRHVDSFLKLARRLEYNRVVTGDSFLLIVTYSVEPEIEEYARDNGIEVVWSFEV